jgi:hypothetical protein
MMPFSRLRRLFRETKNTSGVVLLALPCVAAFSLGCDRKADAVAVAPAVTSLPSSEAPANLATWHYTVDPDGRAHVDLPGLKERIKGDTTAALGTLEVDGNDLSKSRGTVRIDLATFITSTFGNDDDKTQTKHARTWLEVGEVSVPTPTNEPLRYAEFAVRSIDGLAETALAKIVPTHDGGDDVRKVTMTLHGDLLVHGHAVPKDGVVGVRFRYPRGAPPGSKPARIEIDSESPLRVVLKEHDVRPRDPAGQLLEWTTKLIAKVADTADVTVHLTAEPVL